MKRQFIVWIVAMGIAGVFGAPASSSAQVSATGDAAPLDTKFPPEAILGEWVTQREENRPPARFKFMRANDGTYIGIMTWQEQPQKDTKNPDPKLRDRPLVGAVVLWNLRYDDGEYTGGYIYNPEDGSNYRVKTEVQSPELLKVRGYLGISLLGQSKIWLKYHPSS
jgi:uncharacterized protein (DUF2147 family)